MSRENAALVCIDPNKSFIEDVNYTPYLPGGHMNLCVPGAKQGAINTAALIRKGKDAWRKIKVTKDSHHAIHIASPIWHKDKKGNFVAPFTEIPLEAYKLGEIRATKAGLQKYTMEYIEKLEAQGKYKLMAWPPHGIIGTEGQLVEDNIREALAEWEMNFATVEWKIKGDDPYTEHYSGLEAEVPNPKNPATQLDTEFISVLDDDEIKLVVSVGWALSHCKKATLQSIFRNSADPKKLAAKWIIAEDCTCSVPGFEQQGEDFLNEMRALGVRVEKSTHIF